MIAKKLKITLRRAWNRFLDPIFHDPGKEDKIDHLVCYFFRGGLSPKRLKKGKSAFSSHVYMLIYKIRNNLNKLDDRVLNPGRNIRTRCGVTVRSKGEKKIAEMFEKFKIRYRYEEVLLLGNIVLKPDFYLPKENIYVEFWGLTHISSYNRIKKRKELLYKKHEIRIISIYPQDLKDLENVFIRMYEQVVGKKFLYN